MNAFDRHTNLTIITELRNLEKRALDTYIENVIMPLANTNSSFLETLYKDIVYVLGDLDNEEDNNLIIENGDFVFEDGDFKLSGYQTRLHDVTSWLHIEISKKLLSDSEHPHIYFEQLNDFNERFLKDFNFTPEYKQAIDKIRSSLKKEREANYEPKRFRLGKFLDPDILELKPNIMGLGVNLNAFINKFRKH